MASNNRESSGASNESNLVRRALRQSQVKLRDAEVEQMALSGDVKVLEQSLTNMRVKLQNQVGRSPPYPSERE